MPEAGRVVSVQCNHCGAPLDVEETTRFATCGHCGSKLEIKHTGSAYFTSVLERLDQTTQSMAENLEVIRLQNELERVDREWDLERQKYAVRDKQGNISYPDGPTSIVGGVVGVVFGVLWTIMACAITGSAPDVGPFPIAKVVFPLFGVVFVGVGIWSVVNAGSAAGNYTAAQTAYQSRRSAIQRQLAEDRHAGQEPAE